MQKSEWRKEKERAKREAVIFLVVIIGLFLIAGFFDHQNLVAGLLK